MKFHKYAVVIMALLCSAAFAQVTRTCPKCDVGPLSFTGTLNTDSVSKGVILNNTDMSPVPLSWSVAGPGFLAGWISCKSGSISPGKCTISVKFHPTVAGNATGTLTINAGTPNVTTVVPLFGNTISLPPPPNAITISPDSLGFIAALNQDSDIKLLTVSNSGSTPVTQTGTFSNPAFQFAGTGTCGPQFNSGQCTISVKCHPTATGNLGGTFSAAAGVPPVPLSCSVAIPVTKSVQLNWVAPASDGAASYNLYRGGVKVGSVSGSNLTFTNTAVSSGTYSYTARTVDSSGHESVDSTSVSVTIP